VYLINVIRPLGLTRNGSGCRTSNWRNFGQRTRSGGSNSCRSVRRKGDSRTIYFAGRRNPRTGRSVLFVSTTNHLSFNFHAFGKQANQEVAPLRAELAVEMSARVERTSAPCLMPMLRKAWQLAKPLESALTCRCSECIKRSVRAEESPSANNPHQLL
jgi:hypothetical protein